MGHLTSRDAYKNLEDRINLFTQGAPPSQTLTKILKVLFTENEAKQMSQLPIRPFGLEKAAKIWGVSPAQAETILDHLCEKGLMVDSLNKGVRQFVLPPPMIGFFEFALMRTRGDIDQKYLSELFCQYIDVEEDFIKSLFFELDTKLARVFVQEPVLLTEKANHILDYERASHIIEEAEYIGVGLCYCRHKNHHLGKECELKAPMETCLTFDNIARSLAAHGGYARLISREEAKDILETAYGYNLVQIGENVREHPAFMCSCCGCCCEALQAARRFNPMQPIETTNFIPRISPEDCISCGKCARVCPVLAISMKDKKPVIDESICLGCGVCARNCPKKTIILERRPVQVITPVNSTHRFVLQAIEKGTLQNLVFDNQAFANHRALAAVFGAILSLPPMKQALASRQFKSVYLDRLLSQKRKTEREAGQGKKGQK
jgi:Pyruvate/2-oxoacid:ferredoxin oxidoreductase delta subunit